MLLNVHALIISIHDALQLVTNLSNAKNMVVKLSMLTTSHSRILIFPPAKAEARRAAADRTCPSKPWRRRIVSLWHRHLYNLPAGYQ